MSSVQIKGLTKVFGHQPERALPLIERGATTDEIRRETGLVVAVRDINLELADGELFVVMGLSGSGKSTLIRMINLLFTPTAGSIVIDGEEITTYSSNELQRLRSSKVSMVFQGFALFPHRTVLANVGFGLEVRGLSRSERESRSRQISEMVGLSEWADAYPSQLSGGMQQRVGLARALATDASILLMDEAFSALDPLIRREMQDYLLDLQSQLHKTILFISHDLNEAMRLGDRICVMKEGEVVQIGTAEDLLTEPADEYVRSFTQDIDPTRVLTAASIMREPQAVLHPHDGPHVAMRRLTELQRTELYVVHPNGTLAGYVKDTDLLSLAEASHKRIEPILRDDYPRTDPDTLIGDLYALAAAHTLPVAVVDNRNRLVGVVPRISLLAALADGTPMKVVGQVAVPADQAESDGVGGRPSA